MNEELQIAIVELINKSVEATGKATDFVLAETPEFVQQLLYWHMVRATCLMIFFGVLISYFLVKILSAYKKADSDDPGWTRDNYGFSDRMMSLVILGGGFSIVLSIVFIKQLLLAMKIWIAPKVYLVEYAASLIK